MLEVVPEHLLRELAAMLPVDAGRAVPNSGGHARLVGASAPEFDADAWVAKYAPEARGPVEWNGGRKWTLQVCPNNPDHDRHEFWFAQMASGKMAAGCRHESCSHLDWRWFRSLREPGYAERRAEWERNGVNGGGVLNGKSDYSHSVNSVNTVKGVENWEPPLRFHQADVPPFPTEAFPSWLGKAVEAISIGTQTPADLAGVFALSILATACAKKIVVRVRQGWLEPVNLFTVVSMPPASRKSAVFDAMIAPLTAYEIEQNDLRGTEIAEAEVRAKMLEARRDRMMKSAAAVDGHEAEEAERQALELTRELDALKVPARPRLIADDVTQEKLATLLMEHTGRISVLSSEGGVFDLLAGRYSTNNAPNIDVFLKGHAGDTIRVDRVGRPSEFIRRPALTVGLMVQPDVLRGLVEKPGFRGRGLLGRFLYSLPPSLIGYRNPLAPPAAMSVVEQYYAGVLRLLELPLPEDGSDGRIVSLSEEATELLQGFERWIEPQLAEEGELGSMPDWAGKLTGAVARVAGLLHIAINWHEDAPWQYQIDTDAVAGAISIGKYLIPHARAAFGEMGADPVVEDAKRVLRWLREKHLAEFSRRDLWRNLLHRFRTADAMDPALLLLVSHQYLRGVRSERSGPGRAPSPRYLVSPYLEKMDDLDLEPAEGALTAA